MEILNEVLSPPGPLEIQVSSLFSHVSTGTELLYFKGLVPEDCFADLNLVGLTENKGYPVSYGYAVVGTVTSLGTEVTDFKLHDLVFCFHSHGDLFNYPASHALALPPGLDPLDGVFLAQMETALNLVLDLAPLVGERIKVFGLGNLGILCALILKNFPLGLLGVEDSRKSRNALAKDLALFPGGKGPWDGVLEISGSPEAFNQAVDELDFSGRLVLGSWYGNKPGQLNLGGKFHRKRIKIQGSQVSPLSPSLTGLWDKQRLRNLALEWLKKIKPSRFVTHKFTLSQGQQAYELLSDPDSNVGSLVFIYSKDLT